MEPTRESSNSKGKAVVSSSDEPKAEFFQCPRCSRTFNSAPALCGHQNAHRLVKDPMKISPVLAAVLNNPLPPNDKPALIIPKGPKPVPVTKEPTSKQPNPGNVSPRFHPYQRQDKELIQDNFDMIEASYNKNNKPNKKPEGEVDLVRLRQQLNLNETDAAQQPPQYYPFEKDRPLYNYSTREQEEALRDLLTKDLLREWCPMTAGMGNETSYGRTLYNQRKAAAREGASAAGGSNSNSEPVDLELRLGYK